MTYNVFGGTLNLTQPTYSQRGNKCDKTKTCHSVQNGLSLQWIIFFSNLT